MGEDSLRDLLARVQQHLSAGGHVDNDARQQLGTLLRDIEQRAAGAQPAAQTAPRLEKLAVRFEASHPALAESLREVIDTLGKAGI